MTRRRRARITACIATLGLFGAACAGSDDGSDAVVATPALEESIPADDPSDTTATAAGETGTDADADTDTIVPAVLQFSAPLVGGGEIDAHELAGKPTAFWFWSPT